MRPFLYIFQIVFLQHEGYNQNNQRDNGKEVNDHQYEQHNN